MPSWPGTFAGALPISASGTPSNRLQRYQERLRPMSKLKHESALSRRAFLVGMAGAAATFGFAPGQGTAQESGASPFEPTIWYSVDRDGIVTVNITRAEMGQHIGTAVARILADELEVDWSNVHISAVDTDPKWGDLI